MGRGEREGGSNANLIADPNAIHTSISLMLMRHISCMSREFCSAR